jgi:hypothetical protein
MRRSPAHPHRDGEPEARDATPSGPLPFRWGRRKVRARRPPAVLSYSGGGGERRGRVAFRPSSPIPVGEAEGAGATSSARLSHSDGGGGRCGCDAFRPPLPFRWRRRKVRARRLPAVLSHSGGRGGRCGRDALRPPLPSRWGRRKARGRSLPAVLSYSGGGGGRCGHVAFRPPSPIPMGEGLGVRAASTVRRYPAASAPLEEHHAHRVHARGPRGPAR